MSRSRIAVVTGADRGLGLGITKRLLELGWDVFAGSYLADWPELTELRQKEPERLHVIPLDVSSDESVKAASRAVEGKTDRVDVLINNAGIATRYPRTIHEEQVEEELLRIYNVNAVGPMRMAQAFVPLLRAGSGKRMCFVSSEAGSHQPQLSR
ncbi:SDR family NAD(P)-dependent oxidoreductase [Paenibacillus sp. AR247]|uniref:SDR family NAD(P)-dependent oxidoreductase n=1 Tax=Paenibacillus sp. AR247 TaxID=1631599 RepID=UPI000CF88E2D|nr:SDR family NAD(P)-dependent oxidoreductase [Paenibacillus sp. AR247]PQP86054.1 hypothetical protein CPT76_33950 [Paenibacillus sp. AR247]